MSRKKFLCLKTKPSCSTSEEHGNESNNSISLRGKSSVNKEYKEAFRTNSYVEMWNKVQEEEPTRHSEGSSSSTSSSTSITSSSSSSTLHLFTHLSQRLLEPREETLRDILESNNVHRLVFDYFEFCLEAYHMCEEILRGIHQTRANYRIIKKVIKQSQRESNCTKDFNMDGQLQIMFKELARFALFKNPLTDISSNKYRDVHENYKDLFDKLTSNYKRISRKAKFTRFCKKAGGYVLVITYGAISVAFFAIAIHSLVGIAATPGMVCGLGYFTKKIKVSCRTMNAISPARLSAQLDAAAKGMYILINDLDTITSLARRLQDEVEHCKVVASVCVRNGKGELLKEIVNEFRLRQPCFMEQLEELEKHIYSCLLTIKRSRGFVIQEIVEATKL